MAIISSFKSIIYPMETKNFRTTMTRESRFSTRNTVTNCASNNQNISNKKGENKNILPKLQQSSANDETLITVQLNHQLQKRVQRIREEMIAHTNIKCYHVEDLVMIDAIQRLSLQYYFQDEISGALRRHYERCGSEQGDNDLHDTALRFRLLRQHGYSVSADCFSKFKDKDGNFKQELRKDSKGLMSLYEAYHFRVPGDNILDDIGELSGHLLRKMGNDEPSEGSVIEKTLKNPYHTSLPRFMALDFLQNVEITMNSLHNLSDESSWLKEIQYLAAIDINMAQINYQRETTQVSTWWKGLRLTEELKRARNQPAKWHMWSLTCLPSPDMAEQRVELTKAIAFVYIIDDIFDMYGTLDELILFTEAVNKWEYDNITGLPNYMRVCLKNLDELINEISEKAYDIHGWNPKEFLHKVWKDLFNAFLVEAKWFASGHTPSTDEYLKNGKVSTGVGIVCAYLFLLLGEGGNKKGQGLLNSHIEIASLVATIVRLWDDLGSAKDENQDGHDGSYIACYVNEHKGSSIESAREHVHTMISDAWKCLNEMCQSSSPFSAYFKEAVLNSVRMIPVMYSYDESHRLPSLEKYMKSLLISEQTTVS
ncbi:(3S,6E)-nerolidol synthase 1-like [Silene latifolia]|uniref:(3S,6E)-nerolidol synthase 1-like n=1 Tax=Silene latifolia TaxID=37657 RepID=UPI003D77BC49